MKYNSYDNFMKYNRHNYKYFYRTEKPKWIDDSYQYVDDDYMCLSFSWKKRKIGGRHKSLLIRTCIRRLIKPNVDANTLLFNAYEDVHRFYDNSDKELSVDWLESMVNDVIEMDIEEIRNKYSDSIQVCKNRKPKSGIIFKPGIKKKDVNKLFKEKRYDIIDDYYDETLSVKENLTLISEKLFSISKDTLYRYIKERNKKLSGKLSNSELYNIIDANLSFRKNLEILRDSDIKISQKKLQEILKMKKEKKQILDNQIENQNKSSLIFDTSSLDDLNIDIDIPDFTNVSHDDLTLPDVQIKFTEPKKDESNSLFKKLDIDFF